METEAEPLSDDQKNEINSKVKDFATALNTKYPDMDDFTAVKLALNFRTALTQKPELLNENFKFDQITHTSKTKESESVLSQLGSYVSSAASYIGRSAVQAGVGLFAASSLITPAAAEQEVTTVNMTAAQIFNATGETVSSLTGILMGGTNPSNGSTGSAGPDNSHHLSTGAIVGIVIACVVVGVILCCLCANSEGGGGGGYIVISDGDGDCCCIPV